MIGIDIDEAGIKAHGPLEGGDQESQGEGVHVRDAKRDAFALVLKEGPAGAAQKPLQIVATGHPGFDFERRAALGLTDFDERGEEIIHAIAELLHVGMLVGRPLVAVNGNALMDHVAIEIPLLAQRLHHELLEILAHEDETVFIRKHYHILRAFAIARGIPHQRDQHGDVLRNRQAPRLLVHGRRPCQKGININALQGCRDQPDSVHNGRAAPDPVLHGEAFDKSLTNRVGVHFAAHARHRHGVLGKG